MSLPAWGDVPTWGLFAGAVVTSVFAYLAFRKQSREVSDQAELLKVQSDQLDAMRGQLVEVRKVSGKQLEVFALQAEELRESLEERKREAAERHRAQAARVFISEERFPGRAALPADSIVIDLGPVPPTVTATVHNSSEQPIYDAELAWHLGTAPHGSPNHEPLGVIMPGHQAASEHEFQHGTNMALGGAVVRFTDAAGVRWRRRPDGDLTEVPPQPGN